MERESERKLRLCFNEVFFDEFMFDAEFRSIFLSIEKGLMTPYEAIEHLCKRKKDLTKQMEELIIHSQVRPRIN